MGAVTDHKANATLTELNLYDNRVGDAGATALAEALKATVLTCEKCVCSGRVFAITANVASQSRLKSWASSTCCALCVAAFVFFVV